MEETKKPKKHRPSTAEKRFMEGSGQRYTKHGSIRCHALSDNAVMKVRREIDDWKSPNYIFWPEGQCGFPARPGYFICWKHGAGRKGGPGPGRPTREQLMGLVSYAKKDLIDKAIEFQSDPELLNQRSNVAILTARNAQLLEKLDAGGLSQRDVLRLLEDGLADLQAGETLNAREKLSKAIETVGETAAAWVEIRENMRVIKDLTKAEIERAKEMRMWVTADQVNTIMDRMANGLADIIEKQIHDQPTKSAVILSVTGLMRELIGTGARTQATILDQQK